MANDVWSGIVGNAAGALAHPAITGMVQSMAQRHNVPMPTEGIAGYAAGGPIDTGNGQMPGPGDLSVNGLNMSDPRMGMIGDAEDALGHVESGQPLQPQHVAALHRFHSTFGPAGLAALHSNVKAGMTMRPRLVVGKPGKDKVSAIVDHAHKAKLTTGEFVMPVDAVTGAGHGDPVEGARQLQKLSAALSAMPAMGATRPMTMTQATAPATAAQPMGGQPLNVSHVG